MTAIQIVSLLLALSMALSIGILIGLLAKRDGERLLDALMLGGGTSVSLLALFLAGVSAYR